MSTGSAVPLVVVMGVSGTGKSTVATRLARRLAVTFGEGDDFHPRSNVEKMASGAALDDDDRLPWLRDIGAWLAEHAATGAVATCSALARSYRDVLRDAAPGVVFLHLYGPEELLAERVRDRSGHFMPPSLLASQLDSLEPLQSDEAGLSLDVTAPLDEIVERSVAWLEEATGA